MLTPTDAELLALIRDGDRQAKATFAERYAGWARVYARKLGAGDDLARDVAQNVVMDLITRPPLVLRTNSLKPYMAVAIWHEVIRARRRKPTVPLLSEPGLLGNLAMVDNRTSPSAAAARGEILRAAWRALEELRTVERVVVLLRNIDEMSFREISHVTGRAEATERRSHGRALEKLRQKLSEFLCHETDAHFPTSS